MSDMRQNASTLRVAGSRAHACNECKRRKVRCSGGPTCTNCIRDQKECTYTSLQQRFSVMQRRLQHAEALIRAMENAWANHLPTVSLADAIQHLQPNRSGMYRSQESIESPMATGTMPKVEIDDQAEAETSPDEHWNAEDFEFDESQEFDNSTDGMGFLIVEPNKSGYMGSQSGVASLRLLQSLQLSTPIDHTSPPSLDETLQSDGQASSADIARYINDYFSLYHTAYPILHEGTFRARVSGALAKPKDGSWPLLYNIVVALGAFVGESNGSKSDLPFYTTARKRLTMEILEKGSLSYVQGLVLMANYLQKRNKPNSGFVLIGIGFSMALAIGLHREFGPPSSSPFTMEIRRRVWWTLFIFVSGAQLTLGRPAVSLVGVNVRLPGNLDDQDLAVDMDELPKAKHGPTVTSCLIKQVKLAKIANSVQVELLTNQVPRMETAIVLDEQIRLWRTNLPSYFMHSSSTLEWFDIPRQILIWRSFHLRIILSRPILFQTITAQEKIDVSNASIRACLSSAEEAVSTICGFFEDGFQRTRGLAWYATYWLITASFVQATCYAYDPVHHLALGWKAQLKRAIDCLNTLGEAHNMAFRACDILKKLLEQSTLDSESTGPRPSERSAPFDFFTMSFPSHEFLDSQSQQPMFQSPDSSNPFPWYAQGSCDAELLDAAGGFMLQGHSDFTESHFEANHGFPLE